MRIVHRKAVAAAGLSALAMFGAVACSSDSSSEAATSAAVETTKSAMADPATAMADPAANLVGPGCAAYAEQVPTGPGSVTGMAQAPVTVAASNNPMLKTDAPLLTSILTYHVVTGQASPAQAPGDHKTVQGANVTVTGAGQNLKVNDAGVVCGGVSTANATVYMIDTVLMPPAN